MNKLIPIILLCFWLAKAEASATTFIQLSYATNDSIYAAQQGSAYSNTLWKVNNRYNNTDNSTLDYAAVYFDTLQYLNYNNDIVYIPRANSTITINNFTIPFAHNHTTNQADTIRFTLFNTSNALITNYGMPNANFTTPVLWDTLIVVNSTIPPNNGNFTFMTFSPNITLPPGKAFGVRIDFSGDTTNTFQLITGYRSQCINSCGADITVAGNNSAYYLNLTNGANQSGFFRNAQTANYYDCDGNGSLTVGGCENFKIQNFLVYADIELSTNFGTTIIADDLQTCPGASVNVIANTYGTAAFPLTYQWSTSSGVLNIFNNQVNLVAGNGNAIITVTVTDSNNSTVSATLTINVGGISTSISPTTISVCLGQSTTLTASGVGSFLWNTGATTSSITVNPTQTTAFTVTITNSNNCTATASRTVIVNNPPLVGINPQTPIICTSSNSVSLNASGGGAYIWSNGSISSNSVVTSTLQGATYTVTVTGSNGCSASASRIVTRNPVVSINPTSISICSGDTAILNASGGGNYAWNTGDTTSTISVGPTVATVYTLTVTGANNCSTTASRNVNIYTTPAISISADGAISSVDTIINGDVVQLQLNGSLNATPNIQWSPNISINSTSIANPVVFPSTTTTYTVTFTNSNGCQQTAAIQIYVKPISNIGSISITTPTGSISLFDTLIVNVQLTNVNGLYSLYAKLRGDSAVNAYLNYVGFTAGTLLGTGGSILSTPPTVTGNVYDFGITKVGAQQGFTGSGLFYTLKFVTKNVTIPNGTNFCFYLDDVTAYNSLGTQAGLSNTGPYCYVFSNQLNVWPGDLNNSKTVTTADLLPIGYFYNSTGPSRPNATIQWNAQPATLWGYGQSYPNGSAYKVFADSNGDGVISNADQAAIGFNMGQFHLSPRYHDNQERALGDGTITVSANPTWINNTQLPQTVSLQVSLQNNGGLNSLYGISVNLLLDNTVFDLTTANVDYSGSIFGTNGTDCLVIHQITDSSVSVGLTRYASSPINGQGLLCTITLQTKSSVSGSVDQTQITSYVDAANNQSGDPLSIDGGNLEMNIGVTNVGIDDYASDYFNIYPNPAHELFFIESSLDEQVLMGTKLFIFNSTGQLVYESDIIRKREAIPTRNFSFESMYTIEIKDRFGKIMERKKLLLRSY